MAELPDFPGIDPDLLRGRNFQEAIRKLGYESFRFEGDGMYVTCYLWKRDEDTASINYRSSNMELAASGALAAARIRHEWIDGDEPIQAIQH